MASAAPTDDPTIVWIPGSWVEIADGGVLARKADYRISDFSLLEWAGRHRLMVTGIQLLRWRALNLMVS
jgi:hypothetical protein